MVVTSNISPFTFGNPEVYRTLSFMDQLSTLLLLTNVLYQHEVIYVKERQVCFNKGTVASSGLSLKREPLLYLHGP